MAAENMEFKSGMEMDIDQLKANVLNAVSDDNFDEAIELLESYLEQPSEYPHFREKMERLVGHAVDLVNAIKAKKNFPGLSNLTRSKQQELSERITDHYHELQMAIIKMEKIILQFKREDVRSTLWILRAIVYGAGLIAMIAFLKEVTGGLWAVFERVVENALDGIIDWVSLFINRFKF